MLSIFPDLTEVAFIVYKSSWAVWTWTFNSILWSDLQRTKLQQRLPVCLWVTEQLVARKGWAGMQSRLWEAQGCSRSTGALGIAMSPKQAPSCKFSSSESPAGSSQRTETPESEDTGKRWPGSARGTGGNIIWVCLVFSSNPSGGWHYVIQPALNPLPLKPFSVTRQNVFSSSNTLINWMRKTMLDYAITQMYSRDKWHAQHSWPCSQIPS